MRKFILIDHSISGTGGHYLEFASNVLQEAGKDCETYLVTNRLYTGAGTPCEGRTFALYPYDIWGSVPHHEKRWKKLKERAGKLRAEIERKALFSAVFYFVLGFKSGNFFMSKKWTERIFTTFLFLALLLILFPFVLLYIIAKLVLRLTVCAINLFDKAIHMPGGLSLKKLLLHFSHSLYTSIHRKRSITKAFYKATRKALQKTKPQSGDIIFIPTLSLADTRAVYQILEDIPEAKTYQWALLYRRNLFTGRDPGYRDQLNEQLEWRRVFASFTEYQNVRFLTDTEQLKDQYRLLGVVSFEVAPIPMNPNFQIRTREKPAHFQIVYAGDARSEKGYHLLPELAEQFALHKNTSAVSFYLQSNFAFREVRDDPSVVLARNFLEEIDSPKIQLVKKPIPSGEYVDLVCSAAVMPLLYHRDNYYARSSGALAEALAAGIPVVVPSASWLSLQVMPLIIADQLKLHEQAKKLPLPDGSVVGWYRDTDLISAQAKQLKKKSKENREKSQPPLDCSLFKEKMRKKGKKAFCEERLPVLGTELNPANFYQIPEGAQAIFLKFQMEESCGKGVFLRTTVRFYNEFGWEIGWNKMEHSNCKKLDGICTAIFRIPSKAVYARLELSCPYDACFAACLDFCIEFWENGNFALGGNGCIYVENEQIYDCLVEIQGHLDTYWRRAQQNAADWNQFHSTKRLVKMLLANEEKVNHDT